MNRHCSGIAQFAVLSGTFVMAQAHAASTLQAVSAQIILENSTTSTDFEGASPTFHYYTFFSASGGNVSGSDPAVTAGISGGPGNASSYLWYEFEVLGPENATVPVNISGLGATSVDNLSSLLAAGFLAVVLPSDQASPDDGSAAAVLLSNFICTGDSCPSPASPATFNVNQDIDVQTNLGYVVELYATAAGSGGTAHTVVDPTITLATDDPAYALEFSPGVLNPVAPTPEPSTLLLAGTGLLTFAGAMRRRLPAH